MVDRYKVIIAEKNGTELEFNEELSLDADKVYFDPSTTDLIAENIQAAIEEMMSGNIPVESITEFEAFSSPSSETTTSNNWVTKSGYPYTTDIKSAGSYVVNYTAQIGNSANNSEVGFRVQWREGITGTWLDVVDIRRQIARANDVNLTTAFSIVELTTPTEFQIRIQWGQTDSGGTGFISEANIMIGKVTS